MRPDKSLPGDYKIEWLYKYNSDSNSKDNMEGYSDHNKGWPDNRSWEGTEQDRTGRRRSRPRDTARRKRAQRGKRKEHKNHGDNNEDSKGVGTMDYSLDNHVKSPCIETLVATHRDTGILEVAKKFNAKDPFSNKGRYRKWLTKKVDNKNTTKGTPKADKQGSSTREKTRPEHKNTTSRIQEGVEDRTGNCWLQAKATPYTLQS